MKTFLSIAICFGHFAALAQVTTKWMGGYPGQETSWHCPQNWNTHRTPDAFNNVYIPDVSTQSGSFPIIEGDAGSVNALTLESGAHLTIAKSGSLAIEMKEHTLLIGDLVNEGNLQLIPNPPDASISRRAKKSLALNARQCSTVLYATEIHDGN